MTDDDFDAAVAEAVKYEQAERKLSALERLRTSVLKERRLLRLLTIMAIIVGCIGIGLAVDARNTATTARHAAETAQKALDEFQASRNESRVASCHDANKIAQKHNDLTQSDEDTLTLAAKGNGTRTPDEQARVDAFLAQRIAKYESLKIEIRDCSLAGIAKFLAANKEP